MIILINPLIIWQSQRSQTIECFDYVIEFKSLPVSLLAQRDRKRFVGYAFLEVDAVARFLLLYRVAYVKVDITL